MKHTSTTYLPLALTLGLFGAASVSTAQLLVYEGFDYSPASSDGTRSTANNDQLLQGKGGSELGLSGTWNDSTGVSSAGSPGGVGDLYLSSQTFSFGDLATSGNYVRGDSNLNNDIFSRTITADLSSGTDLWFSFLGQNLDTRSAAQGGIVIGNQAVNSSQVTGDDGTTGLNGISIYSPGGNNWGAKAWNGTTEALGGATTAAPSGTIKLLIGHLDFGGGSVSGDLFSFYEYQLSGTDTIAGGSLSLVTSIDNVDVDEAGLDTISIARQVNKAYDEIRIGTSLDDVLGLTAVPEPSAFVLIGLAGLALLRRRR